LISGTKKKADAVKHAQVLNRVGLLFIKPPAVRRAALYLVIRLTWMSARSAAALSPTDSKVIVPARRGKATQLC
jgi:hypothetical protein